MSGKPTFTPTVLTLPNEQVAQAYQSNALTALLPAKSVVTWSATDLPPGLSIDPVTGAITGYPTKAVTNQSVTVTVSNSVGSTIILPKPTIAILPPAEGLAGAWKAVVARDPYINNNLGSRLDITITADGSYTGKFTTGAASTSFTGLHAYHDIVGPTVTASSNLTFSGNVRGNLSFSFDTTSSIPSMVGQITVYPTDGSAPVNHPFTAWQARSTPGHYTGAHNFALQLQAPQLGNIAVPQGDGFGTATVDSKGVVTILGKTADGSSFTCSSSFSIPFCMEAKAVW